MSVYSRVRNDSDKASILTLCLTQEEAHNLIKVLDFATKTSN